MTCCRRSLFLAAALLWSGPAPVHAALPPQDSAPVLDEAHLAQTAFGADAPWYLANIPFLEIDDAEIQRTYYYRWQLYRSHLREIGEQGVDVTEFLADVPWARHPYTDLNDSSSFHLMEGRWLRNPAYLRALIDHLYAGGGNDRHFSESIAAATLAWTEVTGDAQPALRNLPAMEHVFNLWDDHFDSTRGLYWIEPLLDATEYTIASIDASGAGFTDDPSTNQNRNGFTGGYAFRPSINAYQFANALAIAEFASMQGQTQTAADYRARASRLQAATLAQLWNPRLQHFTDVYQRSTPTVQAGEFIRGRELVGFVPWAFGLVPPDAPGKPAYDVAWQHLLNANELGGKYGLRTVEPGYPKYLQQYRYDAATGLRECQWNGPAWPFQTSQALTAMANLLQDPQQHAVTTEQYVHLLRQYTHLHALSSGTLDLEEDYDPDNGTPIVGLPRSHHYNHSTYNDLVLSGLLGIRPHLDDVLEVNPLLPVSGYTGEQPIRYFALEHLRYHGRDLTLLYDVDGTHYHRGSGFSVFAEGRRIFGPAPLGHVLVPLAHLPKPAQAAAAMPVDFAVNVWERAPSAEETNLPIATASSSAPDAGPYQAIDGRLWFFPEIRNGWSPASNVAADTEAWFAVDMRQMRTVNRVDLAFFDDRESGYQAPTSVRLQSYTAGRWQDVPNQKLLSPAPVANGITHIVFAPLVTQQLRLVLKPAAVNASFRLIEFAAYGTETAMP